MEGNTLIRTKLHRLRLGKDLFPRPQLFEWLKRGMVRKLTLLSVRAGAGKITLLVQRLEDWPQSSACPSLDKRDNNLLVFLIYLYAAIDLDFVHQGNAYLTVIT